MDEDKTGLIEFIQDKLTSKEDTITTNEEEYEDTKELIQKLEEVPVEKAEEMQNNNNQQANQTDKMQGNSLKQEEQQNENYITTYNTTNDSYEIYNEKDLLSTTKQTVETENEKIKKNDLSGFYSAQISKVPEKSGKTAIYLIITVVIIILALLFRYNVKKNKKNR